jgi:hypothetical protein
MAYSEETLKNSGDKTYLLFYTILGKKIIRQMFTYVDFTICFI